MRLILTALMVGCFVGQAAASIEVLQVNRGAESRTYFGGSPFDDDSEYDNTIAPGIDGFYSALAVSSSQTNGSATASASASLTTYLGAGITTDNLLEIGGHTFADTSGSLSGRLEANSNSFLRFEFNVLSTTTIDLSLSSGNLIIVKGAVNDDFYSASGATNASIEFQPDRYLALFQWISIHENGDLPSGVSEPFSATLGFDGELSLAPVPEPATIAVWSLLGVAVGGVYWKRRK